MNYVVKSHDGLDWMSALSGVIDDKIFSWYGNDITITPFYENYELESCIIKIDKCVHFALVIMGDENKVRRIIVSECNQSEELDNNIWHNNFNKTPETKKLWETTIDFLRRNLEGVSKCGDTGINSDDPRKTTA